MSLIPVPITERLRSHTSRSRSPNLDHPDGVNLPARNSNSLAQPLSVPPINPAAMNYQALKIESVDRLTATGTSYNAWRAIQTIIMDARGVLNVVNGTEKAPTEAVPLIDWKAKDKFAKAQIAQNIELSLLNDMNHETSHDLWTALEKQFSRRNDEAKAIADAKLRKKKLGDGESLKDHITKLRAYKSDLGSASGSISDSDWKNIILNSLTGDWRNYRVGFIAVSDPETVIAYLLYEAEIDDDDHPPKSSKPTSSTESALQTTSRSSERNPKKCTNCGRFFHLAKECWHGENTKNAPDNFRKRVAGNSNAQAKETKETANITRHEAFVTTTASTPALPRDNVWILDSAATSHFTHNRSAFCSFRILEHPISVHTAKGDQPLKAIGIGSVAAKFISKGVVTVVQFENVLYVPDIARNLISIPSLTSKGMTINFKGNSCSLIGNHGVIGYANRVAGLFHIHMVIHHENANLVSTLDDRYQPLDMWHRRLCHVSENTIQQMVDNEAVTGIKLKKGEHEGKCVECVIGKMHAKPSPARTTRELVPGSIIHSDLEFMIDETFKKATYCLKFVDEASGYVWVYPINDKEASTILHHFQLLDALIENQFKT